MHVLKKKLVALQMPVTGCIVCQVACKAVLPIKGSYVEHFASYKELLI